MGSKTGRRTWGVKKAAHRSGAALFLAGKNQVLRWVAGAVCAEVAEQVQEVCRHVAHAVVGVGVVAALGGTCEVELPPAATNGDVHGEVVFVHAVHGLGDGAGSVCRIGQFTAVDHFGDAQVCAEAGQRDVSIGQRAGGCV
jgi:hypothetical protein